MAQITHNDKLSNNAHMFSTYAEVCQKMASLYLQHVRKCQMMYLLEVWGSSSVTCDVEIDPSAIMELSGSIKAFQSSEKG